jgi:heme exporter protein D
MRNWWRGMLAWPAEPWTSLAVIPLASEPISSIHRLRKGLRDVRDRAARQDQQWAGVTMAGLLSERTAMVLIHHAALDRAEIWWAFATRWPEAVLVDVAGAEPSWRMTATDAAALARCRRGIEPIRITIMPQIKVFDQAEDDAMPMAF